MKRGEFDIALEIRGIECENALDRVDTHRGHEPGIIDLNALDFMFSHDLFPSRVDCGNVRKKS